MPRILHVSKDFAKRYRCQVSLAGQGVPQTGRLDSWSAHLVRINRSPLVVMMNDASLWTLLIPATGVTTLAALLPVIMERVDGFKALHGLRNDPPDLSVLFLPRTNRSLIGSMNDTVFRIQVAEEMARDRGEPMDWAAMEAHCATVPFGALGYDSPSKRMAKLVAGLG
jgi:hypothetical protein